MTPEINLFLRKITIAIVCFCLGSCHLSPSETDKVAMSAHLNRVISGQTIEVIIDRQPEKFQRVRIIGITIPKIADRLLQEKAKTRLKELISSNTLQLELESEEKDRYDRILAHVWHEDILLGEQLAKEGYVIANSEYIHRYSDRIFHAQEYARILDYGIWK